MNMTVKKHDRFNFHKHFSKPTSGVGKDYPLLLDIIPNYPYSVLDFGCGKGGTIEWLSTHRPELYIEGYDPYMQKYDKPEHLLRQWDFTFSGDVMEHIPQDEIEGISYRLSKITRSNSIHFIDLDPARKTFPTGENAHLTVKEADWWLKTLEEHWYIRDHYVREYNHRRRLEVVLGSKTNWVDDEDDN
jgi:hypothetical protein